MFSPFCTIARDGRYSLYAGVLTGWCDVIAPFLCVLRSTSTLGDALHSRATLWNDPLTLAVSGLAADS